MFAICTTVGPASMNERTTVGAVRITVEIGNHQIR